MSNNKDKSYINNSPTVSIIIPVYNKVEYTKKCINSIFNCLDDTSFEIIVVNNASSDGTEEFISSTSKLFCINNQENLGFVEACNIGAAKSSAKYLLFLNNDTEVKDNWISSSIKIMDEDEKCGAVGSKLIFPDGKLQEAGAIIFSDANGWNFGYNDNPDLSKYNEITEVDYCSGASLLIKNDLFKELNGFDIRYAPAYYEDSDLCFRVRKLNYKVIYNPNSVVVHHESVTAGKNSNSGFKKYLEINRKKFYERWKEELKYHQIHPNRSGIKPNTANRNYLHNIFLPSQSSQFSKETKKHVIMFFPQNPIPPVTGAHQRFLSMLDVMHKLGYKIIFFSTTLFGNYPWDRESINFLSKTYDAEIIVYSGSNEDLKYMAEEEARSTIKFNWKKYNPPGLVDAFQSLVVRIKPTITFVNYAYWAELVRNNQIDFGKKLIDMHDLVTLNVKMRDYLVSRFGNTQNQFTSKSEDVLDVNFFKNQEFDSEEEEYSLYNNFDVLFSISEYEARLVEKNSSKVKVVNAPMTFASFNNKNDYKGKVLFIIGDNPFNVQGYYYFALKILPLIQKRIPNFRLYAIGDACKNVESVDGIELLGRVDDLEVMYESSRFSICPLIGQTGMSVKIVESMAHGVPVIALSNSANSSPIEHEKNGLIANNAIEFADYLVNLFKNTNLCESYGKEARKTIKTTFSSFKLKEIVGSAINSIDEIDKKEISTNNKYVTEKKWIDSVSSKNQSRFAIALVEHFGDIVACEPVARFIKSNFPNSHITWYVKDGYKELVTANPNIDEIYTLNSLDEWVKLRENIVETEVIDLHINNRICFTEGSILIKKHGILEINANNYYFYGPLLTSFSLSAGLPPLNAQPKVYIPESAKDRADELGLPKNYIVMHCLSNETERDWNKNKWLKLALHIIEEMNLTVVEIGTSAVLYDLSNLHSNKYYNYCGKLSLLETSEIIKRANLFVGIDSGPAHLANAVNTYGIILLGHYRQFKKYLPYTGGYGDGSNASIIYNHNGPASDISTQEVIDSIEKRLGDKNVGVENKLLENISTAEKFTRLIAFYLPQFHPIPENDRWWGKGFTEWKNVTKAKPLFEEHYQPHLPSDLGYYDLRLSETRKAQADLAREYGIEGFCYWHYWFNGKRLLERPFNDVLSSKEPNFPFCLAWANENWTKRWDGMDSEILQEQTYGGAEDDEAHFNWLLNAFLDKRYIRIENKPVFLVYNPLALPNPIKTIALWQKLSKKSGLKGLYIIAIKSTTKSREYDWKKKGFDAELLFQPNWMKVEKSYFVSSKESIVNNFDSKRTPDAFVTNYDDLWPMLASDAVDNQDTYSSVIPMWDNTARKAKGGVILHNSKPSSYKNWLKLEIERVKERPDDKKLVFLNAWNEWAEGNHLEPDKKYGRGYLKATKEALSEKLSDRERIELMIEIAFGNLRIGDENNYTKYLDLANRVNPNLKNEQLINELIQKKHSKLVNQKGVFAYLKNNFDSAHSLFFEAIELDDKNLVAKRNLAQLYLSTNNLNDSFRICNQILTHNPGDKVALYLQAKTFQKNNQIDKSIFIFKKLILLSKNNLQLIQKIQNELLTDISDTSQIDKTQNSTDVCINLVSIVIPTYNNLEYTKQAIESIQKYTQDKYEIIIVDNASTDNTIKEFESYKDVKVVTNKENLGFPKAVNQGILEAQGDYVLIANNDIVVTEGWLERMVEIAEQHPEVGIVGPISNSVSGRQFDKDAKYESIEEMYKYAAKIKNKNKGQFFEFPRVAFLCTLIKKEVIDKLGGLDERYSPGNFEDDDFCLRAQMAGYKTVVATDVFIHHYGSVSFKADGESKYAKRIEINKQKFIDKWGADPEEIWIKGIKPNTKELYFSINKDLFTQHIERSFTNVDENEHQLAIENFEIAIANFKKSNRKGYENLKLDELMVILGNIYFATRNLEKAKESFENALNENPNSSQACQGLGGIFFSIEEYEAAKTMFEWAVKNDEKNEESKQKLMAVNKELGLDEFDFSLNEN